MTSPPSQLRLGTLHVRSLSTKLGAVLSLMRAHGLHTLCLQETCIPLDSLPAVHHAASQVKCSFFPGAQACNSRGTPYAGVAFLTRWPAKPVAIPNWPMAEGRVAALRVFRPRARPLLTVGVYLHASDATSAATLLDTVLPWAASLGEDFCVMGDFNLSKSHWPTSSLLASGQVYDADTVIGDPSSLPGTRRNAKGHLTGSVLDYMLHSPSVHVRARGQERAVADHDLVYYSLPMLGLPARLTWPPRPRLTSHPPPADAWTSAWPRFRLTFEAALDSGDLNAAWAALSACLAEVVCDRKPAIAPDQARGPRARPCEPHLKAPTYQSILERRLRRLGRRALEFATDVGNQPLFQALLRSVMDLGQVFPELHSLPWGTPEAAHSVFQLAETQAALDKDTRLQHWRATTGEDFAKLCQWVRSTLHVDAARTVWKELWAPTALPEPEGFDRLRQLVGVTTEFPLPTVTGASLFARFKATLKRSTGLDGWGAAAFVSAGLGSCEALALFWAACLQHGGLPAIWMQIRVALLPKADGGLRPISVASAAYRACMTCLLRECRPWFMSWADEELVGGVPGRDMSLSHDSLFSSLLDARSRHRAFVGAKQDVKKCFDTVQWDLALQAWTWLGAPARLVTLLRAFYAGQSRWLAVQGHFAAEPITPTRGILQGCPASVGLLNSLMLLWVRHLRAAAPTISRSVFLDDRALWGTGHRAATDLCTALQAAAEVDKALALSTHPDKLASWATRAPARRVLESEPVLCGPVVSSFKLLGITYRLATCSGAIDAASISEVVTRRCRRIAIAARTLLMRRHLLRSLVISLIAWIGPWAKVSAKTCSGWARSVEAAVGRTVSSRSRLLLWSAWAQPRLNPQFALAFAAIRHELRRVGSGPQPRPNCHACPSLEASLSVFAWSILPSPSGVWSTPFGQFRPGFLSAAVAQRLAEDSWTRQQWANDPKTDGPLDAQQHVCLAYHHKAVLQFMPGCERRVLHAAAFDARMLQRKAIPFDACACGVEVPTRTHVTFDCSADPWTGAQRSTAERRLLLPLVTGLAAPAWSLPEVTEDLLLGLSEARILDGALLVATDGSALQCPKQRDLLWFQHAGWGIAVTASCGFHGVVPGLDRSSAAAERYALLVLAFAAHALQAPVCVYTDNEALVTSFKSQVPPRDFAAYWCLVKQLLPANSSIHWVPAHERHPEWTVSTPGTTEAEIRALNHRADLSAGAATDPAKPAFAAARLSCQEASSWAAAVVKRQVCRTTSWHEAVMERMKALEIAP
ncbi:unnamed protein product [Symbiodinium sp. CCMP2592]|nr:unnamed protein product [Symbiodinium sp. CCMP2592]